MTMHKSMGHYLVIFVLGYIGISILVGLIGLLFSTSMSAMTVLVPFLAASFAGERFLKIEKRLPSDTERSMLTNASFLIFAGINILLIGLAALLGVFGETKGLGSTIFIIIGGFLVFIFLIAYLMIRWAYGSLLNKRADKFAKNDTTFD